MVLGLGGVGKTRLMNKLWRAASESERAPTVLWVSLESEASATETGPLLAIREQFALDCVLFDTALVRYWSATGQPFQLGRTNPSTRSLVWRALEIGSGFVPHAVPLPLTFGADVFRALTRQVKKRHFYERSEFEAIDAMRRDPAALRTRLPHYLGLDIRRRLEPRQRSLIAFYDAYEKQAASTLAARSPWLRELIGTLDRGVHVISTREPLQWDPADWDAIVHPICVGSLPEPESREMLRVRLGALPTELEDRLVDASQCVPFFLEAAMEAYESRACEGANLGLDDLPSSPDDSVAYLLDHLAPEHRVVAVALAAVQVFDSRLYNHLVRTLHLPSSVLDFDDFVDWFFVEELSSGLQKTHDLLTEFVRAAPRNARACVAALEAATLHLLARARGGPADDVGPLLALFGSLLEGWRSAQAMPTSSVEPLIDSGYVLYDAGYWTELAAMTGGARPDNEHPVAAVADFFGALAARRTVGTHRALELFDALEPRAGMLGRHQRSVELEVAYLSELAGGYGRAREEFRRLEQVAAPFDPTDRTHRRARLYHADVLIMDGAFMEGARLLLETAEAVDQSATTDWVELVRHRAHAYRFSFVLDQAEVLYVRAQRAAGGAPALLAKLQTNLAETLCWSDAARALEMAALSHEINLRLGNQIELAKCEAARGLALAKLGEQSAAGEATDKATQHARRAGYPAGVAFALQAQALAAGLGGDVARLRAHTAQLRRQLAMLGTYDHLLLAPAVLAEDATLLADALRAAEWIDRDEVVDRARSCLR